MSKKVIVIGGGAAGFFFAVNCAEQHPDYRITILEKSGKLLEKVRISGGGRCNVTHACLEPRALTKFYPRGEKELLGAFHRFMTGDTISWYDAHGVELKTEDDGRMFPVTDDSETIAQCLLSLADRHRIRIQTHQEVDTLEHRDGQWHVTTGHGEQYSADIVFIASGSALRMWDMLRRMGYRVAEPVPSLFTFNIEDPRIKDLQGLSVERATVTIPGAKLEESGPLLITHWGMSGPAILKLSAWGARILKDSRYSFDVTVNWTGALTTNECIDQLKAYRTEYPKRTILSKAQFKLPSRLWERLCLHTGLADKNWADATNKEIEQLASELTRSTYHVTGKSTFKDEFVTCGGVELDQIDLKTFRSKLHPDLYFAGEVLNIDAITGGFNFQAAWTGAWIAAQNV
ncbi:MAG: NAD(P)/FAD-dependent oxidoreductase [Bacteroidetes bacterium]|nr:NAD(P)/FAD-dependent oxidoreductase [Bacteroidota bacterium]